LERLLRCSIQQSCCLSYSDYAIDLSRAPKTETQTKKEIISQVEIAEAPPDTRQKEETQTETEIDIDIPVISEELATEDTPELAEKRALAFNSLEIYRAPPVPQFNNQVKSDPLILSPGMILRPYRKYKTGLS